MAYTPPWPAYQYQDYQPEAPADPNSQMMQNYQSYGYGPEQQFFNWQDLYDPKTLGVPRPGYEVNGATQQQQPQPQPAQSGVPQGLTDWWTTSSQNPRSFNYWSAADHQ
jgi:hypothetical protein